MSPRILRPFARLLITVLTTFSLVAGVVVSAPAPANAATLQDYMNSVAKQVFNIMNAERALYHLPALRLNTLLMRSARKHNVRMARYNTMSHQLPGELGLGARITAEGYHWRAVGENVAWNTQMTMAGAYYLQRMMYGERYPNDGHRRNILSGTYRDVGVDIYVDATHHKIWLTEDFGRWYGT